MSHGWLNSFLKRNNFVLRRRTTTCQKPPSDYIERICEFIGHVEKRRKEVNFTEIYAMDETAVWFESPDNTCIDTIGVKDVGFTTNGKLYGEFLGPSSLDWAREAARYCMSDRFIRWPEASSLRSPQEQASHPKDRESIQRKTKHQLRRLDMDGQLIDRKLHSNNNQGNSLRIKATSGMGCVRQPQERGHKEGAERIEARSGIYPWRMHKIHPGLLALYITQL